MKMNFHLGIVVPCKLMKTCVFTYAITSDVINIFGLSHDVSNIRLVNSRFTDFLFEQLDSITDRPLVIQFACEIS